MYELKIGNQDSYWYKSTSQDLKVLVKNYFSYSAYGYGTHSSYSPIWEVEVEEYYFFFFFKRRREVSRKEIGLSVIVPLAFPELRWEVIQKKESMTDEDIITNSVTIKKIIEKINAFERPAEISIEGETTIDRAIYKVMPWLRLEINYFITVEVMERKREKIKREIRKWSVLLAPLAIETDGINVIVADNAKKIAERIINSHRENEYVLKIVWLLTFLLKKKETPFSEEEEIFFIRIISNRIIPVKLNILGYFVETSDHKYLKI